MNDTPACPTSEQCSAKERVEIPGSDTRAHAVWWPQMGGYVGRAVITVTSDCPELWLWHDGQFPIKDDQAPRQIHLCDPDQWIELFQWHKDQVDIELNGEAEPDYWDLPEGVSLEEAQEVYRKVIDWGLLEDPRGTEIRTHEQRMSVRMPCNPIPCPPFVPVTLSSERLPVASPTPYPDFVNSFVPRIVEIPLEYLSRMPDADEYSPQAMPTYSDLARVMTGIIHPGPGMTFAPDAKITGSMIRGAEVNPDGSATIDFVGAPILGPEGSGVGTYAWAHYTVHENGQTTSRRWTADDPAPPVVDAAAARDSVEYVRPRWAGPNRPYTPWLDGATRETPLIVGIAEGQDPTALAEAIGLCQRAGLLPGTPAGLLFVPEEMELPEEA